MAFCVLTIVAALVCLDDEVELRSCTITPAMAAMSGRLVKIRTDFDQQRYLRVGSRPTTGEFQWKEVWMFHLVRQRDGIYDERNFHNEGIQFLRGTLPIAEWDTKRDDLKALVSAIDRDTAKLLLSRNSEHHSLEDAREYFSNVSSLLFGFNANVSVQKYAFDVDLKAWTISGFFTCDGEVVRYANGEVKGYVARVNAVVNLLENAKFMPVPEPE